MNESGKIKSLVCGSIVQWRSQKCVMEGVLAPSPLSPLSPALPFSLPLHSLPSEVGPVKSSQGIWGNAVSFPAVSGAEPQPKSKFGAF